jgi:hypothetical protein
MFKSDNLRPHYQFIEHTNKLPQPGPILTGRIIETQREDNPLQAYENAKYLIKNVLRRLIKLAETVLTLNQTPLPIGNGIEYEQALLKKLADEGLIDYLKYSDKNLKFMVRTAERLELVAKSIQDVIEKKGSVDSLARGFAGYLMLKGKWVTSDALGPVITSRLVAHLALPPPIAAFISFIATPLIIDKTKNYIIPVANYLAKLRQQMENDRALIIKEMPWMAGIMDDLIGFPPLRQSHVYPPIWNEPPSGMTGQNNLVPYPPLNMSLKTSSPNIPSTPARSTAPWIIPKTPSPVKNSNSQAMLNNEKSTDSVVLAADPVEQSSPSSNILYSESEPISQEKSPRTKNTENSPQGEENNIGNTSRTNQPGSQLRANIMPNKERPQYGAAMAPDSARHDSQSPSPPYNHHGNSSSNGHPSSGKDARQLNLSFSDMALISTHDNVQEAPPPSNELIVRPDMIGYERNTGNYNVGVTGNPVEAVKFLIASAQYLAAQTAQPTHNQRNVTDMDKLFKKYISMKNLNKRVDLGNQIILHAENNALSAPEASDESLYFNSLAWGMKEKQPDHKPSINRKYGIEKNKENLKNSYINAWKAEVSEAIKNGDYWKYRDIEEKYKGIPSNLNAEYKVFYDFMLKPLFFRETDLQSLYNQAISQGAERGFMRVLNDLMASSPELKRNADSALKGFSYYENNKRKDLFESEASQPQQSQAAQSTESLQPILVTPTNLEIQDSTEGASNESAPLADPHPKITSENAESTEKRSNSLTNPLEEARARDFYHWCGFQGAEYATELIADENTRLHSKNSLHVARNFTALYNNPTNASVVFSSLISSAGIVNQYTAENESLAASLELAGAANAGFNLGRDIGTMLNPPANIDINELPTQADIAVAVVALFGPPLIRAAIADDAELGETLLSTSYSSYVLNSTGKLFKNNSNLICAVPSQAYNIYLHSDLIFGVGQAADATLYGGYSGFAVDPITLQATAAAAAPYVAGAAILYCSYRVYTRNSDPGFINHKITRNVNNAIYSKRQSNADDVEKWLSEAYTVSHEHNQLEQVFAAAYDHGLLNATLCEQHAERHITNNPESVPTSLLLLRYYYENNNHTEFMRHAKRFDSYAKEKLTELTNNEKQLIDFEHDTERFTHLPDADLHPQETVAEHIDVNFHFDKRINDALRSASKHNYLSKTKEQHMDLQHDHEQFIQLLSAHLHRAANTGEFQDEIRNDAKHFEETSGYASAKYYLSKHSYATKNMNTPFATFCVSFSGPTHGSRLNTALIRQSETPISKIFPFLRQTDVMSSTQKTAFNLYGSRIAKQEAPQEHAPSPKASYSRGKYHRIILAAIETIKAKEGMTAVIDKPADIAVVLDKNAYRRFK